MAGAPLKRRLVEARLPHSRHRPLRRAPHPLVDLPTDVLGLVVQLAGLPGACALRQTCWALSQLQLPVAMQLALKLQRSKANLPPGLRTDVRRAPLITTLTKNWSMETYKRSRLWRQEWAELAFLTDSMPIRSLLDAYYQMPAYSDTLEGCRSLRLPLVRNAIQDRLWDVCCGKDRYKGAHGCWITKELSHEEVVGAVASMLQGVGLWWGSTAFFHTEHGRYGYTVFLLAAEQHNLPLVKYLHQHWGSSTTIHARSREGNTAYALCKDHLERMGHSEEQVRESSVLRYLAECGVEPAPLVITNDALEF